MSQNPVDTARTILEKIDQIDEEKPVLDSETYNKDATGKGDEVHTDEGPNNAKKNKKTIDAKPSAAKPEKKIPEVVPPGGSQAGGGTNEDLSVRTEVSESFMNGLHQLFHAHYIAVPESKVVLVDELAEENEELVTRLNDEIQTTMDLAEELLGFQRAIVFNDMCEGLVDTEVEKFKTLSEGIEHADIDEYAEKLAIVKESYFTSESISEDVADDTVEGTPVVTETNSIMEGYANAIARTR